MNTTLVLKLTALTYLGLLAAGALMPAAVGLRDHLKALPPFIRQLFWVYYGFIGMTLLACGAATFFLAEELTSGTPLARSVCGFLALFWTARFLVGTFVFNLQPYLTNPWRRAGLHSAQITFTLLPIVYGWVALKGAG